MAWIALNPQGNGVWVDEHPKTVHECIEDTIGMFVECHKNGLPVFVDKDEIWYIEPDAEELGED